MKGGYGARVTHVDIGSHGAVEVAKADGHGERDTALVGAFDVACYPCSGNRSVRTLSCRCCAYTEFAVDENAG